MTLGLESCPITQDFKDLESQWSMMPRPGLERFFPSGKSAGDLCGSDILLFILFFVPRELMQKATGPAAWLTLCYHVCLPLATASFSFTLVQYLSIKIFLKWVWEMAQSETVTAVST